MTIIFIKCCSENLQGIYYGILVFVFVIWLLFMSLNYIQNVKGILSQRTLEIAEHTNLFLHAGNLQLTCEFVGGFTNKTKNVKEGHFIFPYMHFGI